MTDGPCPSPPVGPGEYTVAEVLVESYRETYPMRLADCTLYPHGMYWTVLCGRELQAAVERGHVVCFGRWASYSCDHLFKDYVDHFWGLRQQAKDDKNKLLERLCKTMLNSLYGKFGQLSPQWEQCDKPADAPLWGRTWEIDHETDERTLLRHLGKHCERQVERADHSKSFAAISAWITAAARERMRELVRLAGDRNCLYVVCDALYCTQAGFNNLQEAGEVKAGRLGKLTVKQYAQNARFIAPNNYRFGGRRVQSGIKADATPLGNDTYSQLEVQGLREITGGRPLPGVLMGERIVSAPKGKRKFHVDADGWTQPLVVYCNEPRHLLAIRNNQLLKLGDVW